eukprot:15443653-Alexandrium_andersonii.AAC.1
MPTLKTPRWSVRVLRAPPGGPPRRCSCRSGASSTPPQCPRGPCPHRSAPSPGGAAVDAGKRTHGSEEPGT